MSIAVFGHGLGWQELSWSERGCGPLGAVPECQGRLGKPVAHGHHCKEVITDRA